MFINKIDFIKAELEISSGCYKSVTQRYLSVDSLYKPYRQQSVKVVNSSGGKIEFCVFTENEYDAYLLSGSVISDLYPVENSADETISSLRGNISKVFVKGVSGESFTSGASCILIQE